MIDLGLAAARFSHYASLMVLFGSSLFPLYAYRSPGHFLAGASELSGFLSRVRMAAGLAVFVSALLWLVATTVEMSGSLSWQNSTRVLTATSFGAVWSWRMLFSLGLTVPLYRLMPAHASKLYVLDVAASGALLASIALTGHASAEEGTAGVLHQAADAAHLLAAGVWLGGLLPLGAVLARSGAHQAILHRFSMVGVVAVLVLVASGLINSWFVVGTLDALFSTDYGRLLLFKLSLFAAMAGFAVVNRFWLMPRFFHEAPPPLAQLRRHVLAEQALGVIVLVAVSVLGTLEPAISG